MYYIVEIAQVEPLAPATEEGTPPEDLPVQYATIKEATEAGKARVAELVQAGFAPDGVTFKVLDQHGKPAS